MSDMAKLPLELSAPIPRARLNPHGGGRVLWNPELLLNTSVDKLSRGSRRLDLPASPTGRNRL
jgi:hypothetical protein